MIQWLFGFVKKKPLICVCLWIRLSFSPQIKKRLCVVSVSLNNISLFFFFALYHTKFILIKFNVTLHLNHIRTPQTEDESVILKYPFLWLTNWWLTLDCVWKGNCKSTQKMELMLRNHLRTTAAAVWRMTKARKHWESRPSVRCFVTKVRLMTSSRACLLCASGL